MADEATGTTATETSTTPTATTSEGASTEGGAATGASGEADASTLLGSATTDTGTGNADGDTTGSDSQASPTPTPVPEDNGVPEAYELKLTVPGEGEGAEPTEVPLDPALVEAATPLLKEAGLTNAQANKILPLVPDIQKALVKQQGDEFARVRAEWAEQAQKDPEIGGAKLDESKRLAAKALDHFTGPMVIKNADGTETPNEFRKIMDESGLGNHPVMLKAFARIGAAMSEDNAFVRNTTETTAKKSREEANYPDDVPQKAA